MSTPPPPATPPPPELFRVERWPKPGCARSRTCPLRWTRHWLQIQLRGEKSNRDGVGARVKVVAGDLVQIDEVHSGRGYQSHFGSRLHFGLGARDRADRVEVKWLGGGMDVFQDVAVDRLLVITEGASPAK